MKQKIGIAGIYLLGALAAQAGNYTVKYNVKDTSNNVADMVTRSVKVLAAQTTVSVPNVVGMTQTAAQTAITTAKLTVGTVTEQYSTTVAAGNVISQNPAAGASVAQNSAVALVVTYASAFSHWQSGNDGGGFFWMLMVGPVCVLSVFISLCMVLALLSGPESARSRRKRKAG